MNRILFEQNEIVNDHVIINDARAEHILKVLHGELGQVVKTGVVNGLIGTSTITSINKNAVTLKCVHEVESLRPWVDIILAPPRPRVMKRLLPQLASMGVGNIVLVGAKKVEKDFWGATLLKEENYRPLLVDGLMQAGTSILPNLLIRRNFRGFVREEMNSEFATSNRIVAHPYNAEKDVKSSKDTLLLAIGPEGGWTDDEVKLLQDYGFLRYSLGSRILRTDTAAISLLAQMMKEFDR